MPEEAWGATVVITHYGPSVRSVDPRYGQQPGSASFCNADHYNGLYTVEV